MFSRTETSRFAKFLYEFCIILWSTVFHWAIRAFFLARKLVLFASSGKRERERELYQFSIMFKCDEWASKLSQRSNFVGNWSSFRCRSTTANGSSLRRWAIFFTRPPKWQISKLSVHIWVNIPKFRAMISKRRAFEGARASRRPYLFSKIWAGKRVAHRRVATHTGLYFACTYFR